MDQGFAGLPATLEAHQIWEAETRTVSQGTLLGRKRYLFLFALPPEGWKREHLVRSHCKLGDMQTDRPSEIVKRLWKLNQIEMHETHWSFNLLQHEGKKLHYIRQRGYWQ